MSISSDNGSDRNDMGKRRRRTMLILAFALFAVSGCMYFLGRAMFLMWTEIDTLSRVVGAFLYLAEIFIAFHSVSYIMNYISSMKTIIPDSVQLDPDNLPSVAILVPARHEPREVLDRTFSTLDNLDYSNKTIYLLDDSSDQKFIREASEIAAAYGAEVFRRETRHGAKAGIINDCLKTLSQDYIAIFDADQNPLPIFLTETVSLIEANPGLAFVQTPQFYTNIEDSPVAFAANLQNCVFYEVICEGKSNAGSMICCGTNVLIRREALLDVGGFDESSITEDFATTLDFHAKKWESLYLGSVSVFGSGPETLFPYLKQQWRWSRGNLGVLKKLIRYFFRNPLALTARQWWEHFGTGSYFLIGWVYMILMLCPILYVFFDVPTFFMNWEGYIITFAPYFVLSMTIFYTSMSHRRYPVSQLIKAVMIGILSLPTYMRAFVSAFFNMKTSFQITDKSRPRGAPPSGHFWPQFTLWLVNYSALVWGINRAVTEMYLGIVPALFWIAYHTVLLSSIFYFLNIGEKDGEAA